MDRAEVLNLILEKSGNLAKAGGRMYKRMQTEDPHIQFKPRERRVRDKWREVIKVLEEQNYPAESYAELAHSYVNNLTTRPVCKFCSGKVSFFRFNEPYGTYCSARCQLLDPEFKAAQEQRSIKKCGVKHHFMLPEVKAVARAGWQRVTKEKAQSPAGILKAELLKERKLNQSIKEAGVLFRKENKEIKTAEYTEKLQDKRGKLVQKFGAHCWKITKFGNRSRALVIQHSCGYEIALPREAPPCPGCEGHKRAQKQFRFMQRLSQALDIKIKNNVLFRTDTSRYMLDLVIDELVIEVNGLYWHSEAVAARNKKFNPDSHQCRFLNLKAAGFKLINIWEDQLNSAAESKIMNSIKYQLNLIEHKIGARKLTVLRQNCSDFLNANSLEEADPNESIYFSLVDQSGEIIMAASFGKILHHEHAEYQLFRMVTKQGIVVHGGVSRLLKHARGNLGPFIATAPAELDCGESFKLAGGISLGLGEPDYCYFEQCTGKRLNKSIFTEDNFKNCTGQDYKQECGTAQNATRYRIFNTGQYKFLFD
jgi:hypothetical protein